MTERIPALQKALAAVENSLDELTRKVDVDEAVLQKAKRTAVLAAAGVAFDILLTIILAWGLGAVDNNQERIDRLHATQQEMTERNRAAQCAVNALFLQFEPRTTTNPTYSEEQRRQQLEAYKTLRQISTDLGCPKG